MMPIERVLQRDTDTGTINLNLSQFGHPKKILNNNKITTYEQVKVNTQGLTESYILFTKCFTKSVHVLQ